MKPGLKGLPDTGRSDVFELLADPAHAQPLPLLNKPTQTSEIRLLIF